MGDQPRCLLLSTKREELRGRVREGMCDVSGHVDFPSSGICFERELVRIVCNVLKMIPLSLVVDMYIADHTSFPPL